MLGEDFEEEQIDDSSPPRNLFKQKKSSQEEKTEYSTKKKKDKPKKHSKKTECDNCKSLKQKINELEQLNEELLKIKEKLSRKNEELSQRNEELISKNNELISNNIQLKEENNKLQSKNNELIEEQSGYKTEISGLKKQLVSKINEISLITKEKEKFSPSSNNSLNKKDETKTTTMNADVFSLNSDSIPPKKDEINNMNKYCTLDIFNELKMKVEALSSKVNELEKWKNNMLLNDANSKKKSRGRKTTSIDKSDKNDLSSRHRGSRSKKLMESTDKLSKSLIINQNSIMDHSNLHEMTDDNDMNNNKRRDSNSKMNKSFSKKKNKEIEKKNNNNQRFNSKIIIDVDDLDLIARGLVKDELDSLKNLRVGYKLVYRASDHGEEAEVFHKRCDNIEGSLTVIKTKEGNIFGGYTSLSWSSENKAKKKEDENAFVFSLDLEKLYFESDKKELSIFCDENRGPCFIGMFIVEENTSENQWKIQVFSGDDSPFEKNEEFEVEELEIFQVIVDYNK